ncbi:MAG: threonine ammonia-lyase [Alphaproteobacteria bacterium]
MTSSPVLMPDDPAANLPIFADVEAAAKRLKGLAVRTPLIESPALNERVGGRILLKAETLQRTGSFKFRGAYNRISQIPEAARSAGVVAYSSGNHAQGVAAAAALLGLPATIIMPADAPAMKLANTRAYGAEVIPYERNSASREALATDIAKQRGATLVPPFDDARVIAGQGTCGLEIAEQAASLGTSIDALLVCCGGGGLTAGCALAMAERSPNTAIYTVEPEDFDDTRRSLASGERLSNADGAQSICDALLSPEPGVMTFAINRRHAAGGLAVSDAEVAEAMAFAYRTLKLVVEPGGAVALAAVLTNRLETRGKTIAVVLSGGNVDPQAYAKILTADPGDA